MKLTTPGVRVIKEEWSPRARGVTKSTNGDQKEDKSFCLTDKPFIALYLTLSCLDGWCAYFTSTKTSKKVCAYFSVCA